ncbi:MAG: hypothetical protein NTV46_01290 [Verrucomicrobia bacterium]|nr:hypothetical protein [Verrucomicrobiota bacterium]
MSATEKLNTLYQEMVAKYAGGLSNTSTAKFYPIRELFGGLFGVSSADVYAVGAGTRTTNLPIRFSQGRQATQETSLGVGFVIVPEGKTSFSTTNSATTTLRNYAERGRGHYKAMILVVVENGSPKVTRMMKYRDVPYDAAFSVHFPDADIVDAIATGGGDTQTDGVAPEEIQPEDSWEEMPELFTEGAEISAKLKFGLTLVQRLLASLCCKHFVILTGLSGSGKTKICQALARWLTVDPGYLDPADRSKGKKPNPCYALIPVGADWSGNENILGYPDGLNSDRYVSRPALDLIRHACEASFQDVPHFLILDEMNLSHVERYFADFLSMIESDEGMTLYCDETDADGRPQNTRSVDPILKLPANLFVIGTVNVDETTYMFSPKVLDRANVIEFGVGPDEMAAFLRSPESANLEAIDGLGKSYGPLLVSSTDTFPSRIEPTEKARFEADLKLFYSILREHGAEFGFRVANEAWRFVAFFKALGAGQCWEADPENLGGGSRKDSDSGGRDRLDHALDSVVYQKFLPKLHGSKVKLGQLLKKLYAACIAPHNDNAVDFSAVALDLNNPAQSGALKDPSRDIPANARYKLSAEKIYRMWRHLNANGFTSFPES